MPYGIEVINKSADSAEVTIYGYITDEKWMDTDVTPQDFKSTMDKLKDKKEIQVLINSGGGGVFAGYAIYNIIKSHPANTTGIVQGIAASTASWLLQACKNRIMPKNAMIMIHNPAAGAFGEADDLRETADFLDKIKTSIIDMYAERTKVNSKEIASMMNETTWMTGEEAVVFGFADVLDDSVVVSNVLSGDSAIVNGQKLDIKAFKNFPKDRFIAEKPVENVEKNVVPDFSYFDFQIVHNLN